MLGWISLPGLHVERKSMLLVGGMMLGGGAAQVAG
jgi:hypothetical protein